jgi:hypothetical protein
VERNRKPRLSTTSHVRSMDADISLKPVPGGTTPVLDSKKRTPATTAKISKMRPTVLIIVSSI